MEKIQQADTHTPTRREISRPHFFVAVFLNAAALIALCLLAPRMYPLHPASSANFWYAVTGVDIGATRHDQLSFVIFDRDQDRFVFGSQYPFYAYPDNPYEAISEADAEADFPRVQKELAKRAALNDPDDVVAAGYAQWSKSNDVGSSITGLLGRIDAERVRLTGPAPDLRYLPSLGPAFKAGLEHVARTARLYWANFVFELLLFSGVIWFALLPYIRRASTAQKLLRIAAVPSLLYLPLWLGYCNPANPGFPVGGILYPFLDIPPALSNYLWEDRLLAQFPPFFLAITQGRAYSFADYPDLRGDVPYYWGPVNVALLSLAFAGAAATCHIAAKWWNKRRNRYQPGFPVLAARGAGDEDSLDQPAPGGPRR